MIEKFTDLLGCTLKEIAHDGESMTFTLNNGEMYKLFHQQDCCEYVYIEDICGNLDDLIGSPLLMADEATSENVTPEGIVRKDSDSLYDDSFTWTFYKLATIKGYVTIRFYGMSNGYYSETVDFMYAGGGR